MDIRCDNAAASTKEIGTSKRNAASSGVEASDSKADVADAKATAHTKSKSIDSMSEIEKQYDLGLEAAANVKELAPYVKFVKIESHTTDKGTDTGDLPPESIVFHVITNAGLDLRVEMRAVGYRVISRASADASLQSGKQQWHDTLHSVLLKACPSYVSAFNGDLFARLQNIANMQQ